MRRGALVADSKPLNSRGERDLPSLVGLEPVELKPGTQGNPIAIQILRPGSQERYLHDLWCLSPAGTSRTCTDS